MWRVAVLTASYAVALTAAVAGALWLRWELQERRRRPHLRIIRQTHPPRSHVRVLP